MVFKKQFIAMKVISLSLLCLLLSACNKNPDRLLFQKLNKATIAPGYEQLKNQAGNIKFSKDQCISGQSERALEEMRHYWRTTMDAWQSVQWIKFGPITEDSREWQIQFWPDQKNIIGRKVNALLGLQQYRGAFATLGRLTC
jgi:predicted lipoprotein